MGSQEESGGCALATAVVGGFVLLVFGFFWFLLYWPDRWSGDVPAVVEEVDATGRYSVRLTDPLPADALTSGGSGLFGPDSVRTRLAPPARPGERVVCRVEQSYSIGANADAGPDSWISGCRR